MQLSRRTLVVATGTAVSLGITWALATGVINIFPATLTEIVSLPSETITAIQADAISPSGQQITRTVSIGAGTSGPYSVDLTVDGGDPSNPDDPGLAYRPYVVAYVTLPGVNQSYIEIYRNTAITLDNTTSAPSASASTTFSYPTSHVSATVSVIGGKLTGLQLYGSGNNAQNTEYYTGYSYTSYSTAVATANTTVALVTTSSASVYGTAYLVAPDGSTSERQLSTTAVSLGASTGSASWTIDLTNTGTIEGDIITTVPSTSTAVPSQYYVMYSSTSPPWIYGNVQVDATLPTYALTLAPGDYSVYLRSYFNSPSQYFDTTPVVLTVAAGQSLQHDFTNELAVARVGLNVDGFYTKADLYDAYSSLRGPQYERYATAWQLDGQAFSHLVTPGAWQIYDTQVLLYDPSNPALPIYNYVTKIPLQDDASTPATLVAGGDTSLGSTSLTLVKSNVYFDVVEPAGTQSQTLISNPHISAWKYDYNPDSSPKSQTSIDAYGSSTAQAVSGLTMVAEPGEYQLTATATVNGTTTVFPGSTITFGDPVNTPTGSPVDVVLTPVQNSNLQVDLTFDTVTASGYSTVVESPLGPSPPASVVPPEGLQTACLGSNPDGVPCTTVFYDITTKATWSGSATVCVRRLFEGLPNGLTDVLRLYHYNTTSNPAAWEELPPPPGRASATIDCGSGDPADLAACGCADEASCGIDLDAGLDVFQTCGVTTSFSPFAVFQAPRKLTFTNVVGGTTYTGPIGPPSLQQWTVPATGTYRITATGARGATATAATSVSGGCGAEIAGNFALTKGDVLQIAVGQSGTAATNNAGGGGGTFVLKNNAPLVIAGGGGGVRNTATVNGRPGTTASSGTAGSTTTNYTGGFIPGGSNGAGGSRTVGYGAGGGGWSGNGATDGTYGQGGFAFQGPSQGKGGTGTGCGVAAPGGYGGGGAGNGCYGAGGGGGYSGGGGGRIAGGGGSLNNGASPTGVEGVCTGTGHGKVVISSVLP